MPGTSRLAGRDASQVQRRDIFGSSGRRSVSPNPIRQHIGGNSVYKSQTARGRPSSTPHTRIVRENPKFSSLVHDTAGEEFPFVLPGQNELRATERQSLPAISTIRRRISTIKSEEELKQFRSTVNYLLAKTRGEFCDWQDASSERLQTLPGLLSRANMPSELTRCLLIFLCKPAPI